MDKMPTRVKAICTNCKTKDVVYWGPYGSEECCQNCLCPPVAFKKVGA